MLISDWSSDVCSSDLHAEQSGPEIAPRRRQPPRRGVDPGLLGRQGEFGRHARIVIRAAARDRFACGYAASLCREVRIKDCAANEMSRAGTATGYAPDCGWISASNHSPRAVTAIGRSNRPLSASLVNSSALRSEKHTSELQSLMRISYAVFCLKKKKR